VCSDASWPSIGQEGQGKQYRHLQRKRPHHHRDFTRFMNCRSASGLILNRGHSDSK
jgi:hypothetical protein